MTISVVFSAWYAAVADFCCFFAGAVVLCFYSFTTGSMLADEFDDSSVLLNS
jgi:hypothetical protein